MSKDSTSQSSSVPLHESVAPSIGVGINFIIEALRVGENETLLHLRLLSYTELKKLLSDFQLAAQFVGDLGDIVKDVNNLDDNAPEMPYQDVDATHALNFTIMAMRAGPHQTLKRLAEMDVADRVNLAACFDEFYFAMADMQNAIANAFEEAKEPWAVR